MTAVCGSLWPYDYELAGWGRQTCALDDDHPGDHAVTVRHGDTSQTLTWPRHHELRGPSISTLVRVTPPAGATNAYAAHMRPHLDQPRQIRLSDYTTPADLEPHTAPCPDCTGERMYRLGCWKPGDPGGTCTCPEPQAELGLFRNTLTLDDVRIRRYPEERP